LQGRRTAIVGRRDAHGLQSPTATGNQGHRSGQIAAVVPRQTAPAAQGLLSAGGGRIYLDCPFKEKDKVKELGAEFDWDERKWFVPAGMAFHKFSKWISPGELDAMALKASTVGSSQPAGSSLKRARHDALDKRAAGGARKVRRI